MVPEFRVIDWIAIFAFTHMFWLGIMGLLYGGFLGGIILFVSWELWGLYEQWRIKQ